MLATRKKLLSRSSDLNGRFPVSQPYTQVNLSRFTVDCDSRLHTGAIDRTKLSVSRGWTIFAVPPQKCGTLRGFLVYRILGFAEGLRDEVGE